ncbi:MAG: amidohydrolase family protein [Streptosporangiales bacterium]|nr:amidohydrolase family protein [Streptosporangiales bacterium]MBO0891127.1 amidohydrolase family protein [Acidothermales bacterium]
MSPKQRPDFYDRSSVPTGNLLANARKQALARGLYDFPIIDVDAHHREDTASWQGLIPYIEDDAIRMFAEDVTRRESAAGMMGLEIRWHSNSGRIVRPGVNGFADSLSDDGRDPLVRRTIWAMDEMAIDYTILFPTAMLFLGLHPQPQVEAGLARAYSKWLTREILPQDERIKTMLYLPFNDPQAALRIVEDFSDDPAVVGFMVTSVRYKPVHSNEFAPIYAALQERNMPLAFHAAYNWNDQSLSLLNKFISAHALGFTTSNMVHLTNMLMNGIPERFPRLKLLWVESGLAWLPFMMQRLDNEYLMRTAEAPALTKLPSDYMRDMWYSSQPMERSAKQSVMEATFDIMDAERTLLYSSDYPHWDFDAPSTIYDLPFLTEDAKRRILGGNALDLFGFKAESSATPPDDDATVTATEHGEPVAPPIGP